jgi:hypothetical protein
MAAQPAELPRLSEVESASFDHLTDAAAYYRRAAGATERAFTAVRDAARHPGGTEWVGQAQETYVAERERDLVIAAGAVCTLARRRRGVHTGLRADDGLQTVGARRGGGGPCGGV